MNESNEFYREEINKMLASIDRNDVLEYVYTIVSDIMGEEKWVICQEKTKKETNCIASLLLFQLSLIVGSLEMKKR